MPGLGGMKISDVPSTFTTFQADLCHAKEFDGMLPSIHRTLFSFDLLEAKTVSLWVEVIEARPIPLLVLLGIFLLQTVYVLSQLLQDLLFELTLDRLTPSLRPNLDRLEPSCR